MEIEIKLRILPLTVDAKKKNMDGASKKVQHWERDGERDVDGGG